MEGTPEGIMEAIKKGRGHGGDLDWGGVNWAGSEGSARGREGGRNERESLHEEVNEDKKYNIERKAS